MHLDSDVLCTSSIKNSNAPFIPCITILISIMYGQVIAPANGEQPWNRTQATTQNFCPSFLPLRSCQEVAINMVLPRQATGSNTATQRSPSYQPWSLLFLAKVDVTVRSADLPHLMPYLEPSD